MPDGVRRRHGRGHDPSHDELDPGRNRADARPDRAAEAGILYVDAPVSGGEKGARDGTLAIMAGGAADVVGGAGADFRAARPRDPCRAGRCRFARQAGEPVDRRFEHLCRGRGAACWRNAVARTPAKVREALLGGFADSTVLRQHGQRMIEGDFVPGGPAKYQIKDTGTALALAGFARAQTARRHRGRPYFSRPRRAWRRRPRPQRRHSRIQAHQPPVRTEDRPGPGKPHQQPTEEMS